MNDISLSNGKISVIDGKLVVSDHPVIPLIRGDGIGPEIAEVTVKVIDSAVEKTYGDDKKIVWLTLPAGETAYRSNGVSLPEETVSALKDYVVALKGPLTTPVGGGIRSLNVALRQLLDLYACVRPCKWIKGVPSPVKHPENLNVVIFRENTEDVYSGIEWQEGTPEAQEVWQFLTKTMKVSIRKDSGIGVKPISRFAVERLIRAAITYALEKGRKSVTLVHKGNIMKFTEGAFRDWGYELAKREFREHIFIETKKTSSQFPLNTKLVIKDRITDSMFQQVLLRPEEYDIIATTNLNGDYLSDACSAQVGGIGLAPSGNINFETKTALFEPTHGTAPKYAGLDKVNPSAMILSGVMLLEYIGWKEAGKTINDALDETILKKKVTYDLARTLDSSITLKTSEFGEELLRNM